MLKAILVRWQKHWLSSAKASGFSQVWLGESPAGCSSHLGGGDDDDDGDGDDGGWRW